MSLGGWGIQLGGAVRTVLRLAAFLSDPVPLQLERWSLQLCCLWTLFGRMYLLM